MWLRPEKRNRRLVSWACDTVQTPAAKPAHKLMRCLGIITEFRWYLLMITLVLDTVVSFAA